ncbi:Signal transducing adapter molecule, putative [Pediculus humanus corporis]|uniref:Signal transducing adapter molecule, putative n=1 Tax=Pediculus humanus subsp. corporis TaxID=121224 RepID=E0W250_PEDHC|nr:Signal transducing adapter molecule, putative [Pediculus humanus corporis]EEB19706.1 Signal transducing adapter molecule, putative [Pediculus humanus corporis]
MGFFGNSSAFDSIVEQATNEKNTSEEWGKILDICDKVGNSSQKAKDCLSSILRRVKHQDPHVALQAITLLEACVNNCGKPFHLVVASREFEQEFKKIISKGHPKVCERLLFLLRSWAEGDFKSDPQLNLIPSLYIKLRQDGIEFPSPESSKTPKPNQISRDPNAVDSQREVDDIAKAIELSLKDVSLQSKSKGGPSGSTLYPSTAINTPSEGRKVRALYDFEAVEENELTFKAGEIIYVTDDGDPNWWKGNNKTSEGLFPSNFVTADLSVEPEQTKLENKKTVQFNDSVKVKKIKDPTEVVIDESKMDTLLHYLHEADPRDSSGDSPEMRELAEEVYAMGPLIDAKLEKVDRKHAQLTQLSSDLVEALNLYHSLMREPTGPGPSFIQKPGNYGYMPIPNPPPVHQPQFNGNAASNQPYVPANYSVVPGNIPQPFPNGPPPPPPPQVGHYIADPSRSYPVVK